MPKMLTQVWKTFMGTFFETEEEARHAEFKHRLKLIMIAARKKAMAPVVAEWEKNNAVWEKSGRRGPGPGQHPEWTNSNPGKFFDVLVEELDAEGFTFTTPIDEDKLREKTK